MTTLHVKSPNGTQKDIDLDKIAYDIKTGSTNGTISVNGSDVSIKGLGSAAYTASTDYLGATATAAAATKLATARTIDGVDFNGTAAIIHYGTCSTAAGTAAKTVACTSYKLVTGSRIVVKFTVTNTAANPTLNVNSTGAKAIQYRGSAIGAGNLAANRTYEFIYDGTNYQLVGDLDTNTQNVTGVKGDSETSYRTGNVNITAANIGAAASNHNHDSEYLKLSGGTLNNNAVILGAGTIIGNKLDTSYTQINGGTATANGATINLFGKSESTRPGYFYLTANNGTTSKKLEGRPDGTLLWNNKNVITSAGGTIDKRLSFGAESEDHFEIANAIDNGTFFENWNDQTLGARLVLRHISHPNLPGRFELDARNDSTSKVLVGDPSGALTWDGKNIAWDVKTGTSNGTISVNGSDVAVKGLGSAAYTASTAYATSSHNHDSTYLKLTGGTLTGNLIINKSAPRCILKDTVIARNTAPSSNYTQTELASQDKNGNATWGLYHRYNTDKSNRIDLIVYNGTTTDTSWSGIGVGYDSDGNAFTYAPTPASSDNSTKIATTAYVKAQGYTTATGHNHDSVYFNVAGDSVNGTITCNYNGYNIRMNDNTHELSILGGNTANAADGAKLYLRGGSRSSDAGTFLLQAGDSSGYKQLVGKPDGTLTWNGENIACITGSKSDNGYQKFSNGIIIQWGTGTIGASEYVDITFPIEFPNRCSNVQISDAFSGSSATEIAPNAIVFNWMLEAYKSNNHKTKIRIGSKGHASDAFRWFAIGY